MTETSHSQRRACALVGMDPKTYRYESRRPDDAGIRKRLRELAEQRRRFGYRRLHILLAREGIRLNHKKLYRSYREERLTVRKRALGTRAPLLLPWNRNQRWSLDFVADALADGRRFRILAVVDDFSRELPRPSSSTHRCLGVPRGSGAGTASSSCGAAPRMLVSDNGGRAHLKTLSCAGSRNAALAGHYIAPGKAHAKTALSRASNGPACATSGLNEHLFAGPGRSAADHRGMEVRLQHNTAPHTSPGWAHTQRVLQPAPNWGHNLKKILLMSEGKLGAGVTALLNIGDRVVWTPLRFRP